MARNHATLYASIWTDPDFVSLTVDAQRLYMLILSQPDLSTCGVIFYRPKIWATLADGTDVPGIETTFQELVDAGFMVVDHDTDEAAIRTFMRHDGVLRAPNIFKSAARSFGAVHSETLRNVIVSELPPLLQPDFPDRFLDMPPKEIGALLKEAKTAGQDTCENPSGNPSRNPSENPSENPSRKGRRARSSTLHPPPSSSNPPANPPGSPRTPPRTEPEPPTPPEPSPTVPAAEAAGEEEEEEGNPRPLTATEQTALVEAAIAHMAKCDHHHATLDGTHIRNPDAYRRRCADTRRQTHHDALTNLATRATTATDPIDLAEHLDATCGPLDGGTERAARRYAADQARIAAEDAEHAETVARREAAEAWLDQLDPTRRSELETEAEATATRIGDRPPPYFVKQRLIALALDAMTADQEATA